MGTSTNARHRAVRPAAGSPASAAHGKRRDIQGLRMIAVVAVVANHLVDEPRGGFVGVDVFFVISGFLITGLLVRDLGRGAGPVRYVANFYRRRARRLMPAALVVIVATVLVAYVAFDTTRSESVRGDGLWSAVFWANWHFAAVGTDYFAATAPPSPLQHYWSLSVEEQFYVVWPVALFLLTLVGSWRRSVDTRRLVIGVASVVTVVGSAGYGFLQSSSDPNTAYFSTFTRGWELALGAAVACAVPYLRATRAVLTIVSWLGMGLIGVSLFVAQGGVGFPLPGAILPCVGAALVVAATSTDGARAANVVLTNRVSVFVGDISYSVYLVHFPVIILLPTVVADGSAVFYAAATALTLGLAVGLYGLVEKPVLNSGWLQPTAAAPDTAVAASEPFGARRWAAAAAVIVVGSAALVAIGPAPGTVDDSTSQQIRNAARAPDDATVGTPPGSPQAVLTGKLRRALSASTWPTLSPTYESLLAGPTEPPDIFPCGMTRLRDDCIWGDASAPSGRTMVIVGDSTSVAYAPAFRAAAALLPGWKIRSAGGFSCNFGDTVETIGRDIYSDNCADASARS